MAHDYEYTTRLRVTSDLDGCVATEKAYGRLIEKAKELGKAAKEENEKTKNSFAALSKAVGAFRKVIMGFGVVGLFAGIITSLKKVAGSFAEAKKHADEMAKIQKDLGESTYIQNLAQQYDKLADSATKAANAENATLEQIDTDIKNRRRLDKAKLEAEKQKELEALDPSSQTYSEEAARIEAKYSAMSANMEASNAREDLVVERQKLGVKADQKDREAKAQDAQTASIRAQIEQAKRKKSAAEIASVDLNEADKNGFWEAFGTNIKNILTLNWGRVSGAQTEEGDRIRREKAKEAADYEMKISDLEENLRKSEDKAAELRQEAGNIRTKRDSMGAALEASDLEIDTSRRKGDVGIAKADAAMEKKVKEIEDKIAKQEDAERAKVLLEQQKAQLERQIAEQKQLKADAGANVFLAQGALTAAKGNRRGVAGAAQNLADAQTTAQEVEFSAGQLINSLTEKLKQVNSLLNKANSAIEQNNSQRLAAQAEALTTN